MCPASVQLLGEQRHVVHETPGTTRDAVATPLRWREAHELLLIDTAGLRRRFQGGADREVQTPLFETKKRTAILVFLVRRT